MERITLDVMTWQINWPEHNTRGLLVGLDQIRRSAR